MRQPRGAGEIAHCPVDRSEGRPYTVYLIALRLIWTSKSPGSADPS